MFWGGIYKAVSSFYGIKMGGVKISRLVCGVRAAKCIRFRPSSTVGCGLTSGGSRALMHLPGAQKY
jgi:hypothetical protein